MAASHTAFLSTYPAHRGITGALISTFLIRLYYPEGRIWLIPSEYVKRWLFRVAHSLAGRAIMERTSQAFSDPMTRRGGVAMSRGI
jgi:hypothetical protein